MIAAPMSPSKRDEKPGGRRRAAKAQRSSTPAGEPGVLSNLPNTRPQRPSARRAAARRTVARGTVARGTVAADAAPPAARATPPRTRATAPAAHATPRGAHATPPATTAEPPVPRQGFEIETEIEPGRSLQPPSGTEVAASVAELFGELAQTGLAAGGRLLKDALARLAGS
jgi:hypothetical protein